MRVMRGASVRQIEQENHMAEHTSARSHTAGAFLMLTFVIVHI